MVMVSGVAVIGVQHQPLKSKARFNVTSAAA
jgi:hypothetical protein